MQDNFYHVFRGAAWSVGARVIIKTLGLINTVVMTRILAPDDFGVVALGMLVVGMIQSLFDMSVSTAILRKHSISDDEVDSAWTLRAIQGFVIGVSLLIISPIAQDYFSDERSVAVLYALAACVILAGFSSMGPTLAFKNLEFMVSFKIDCLSKLASVVTSILVASIWPDHRALIAGIAAGYITPLLTGYIWTPYRPKWSTIHILEIWNFSKWLMLSNSIGYLLRRGDELIAGKIATPHDYGIYHVSADLGQLPIQEVGPAIMKSFLPVLAAVKAEREKLNEITIKAIAALSLLLAPICFGFLIATPALIHYFMGERWASLNKLIPLFALMATLRSCFSPVNTLLTITGDTKSQWNISLLEFVVFLASAISLIGSFHIEGLALARLFGTLVGCGAFVIVSSRRFGLSLKGAILATLVPCVGAATVFALVYLLCGEPGLSPFVALKSVGLFVVFYIIWCLGSWFLRGRPAGLESTLLNLLKRLCSRVVFRCR